MRKSDHYQPSEIPWKLQSEKQKLYQFTRTLLETQQQNDEQSSYLYDSLKPESKAKSKS